MTSLFDENGKNVMCVIEAIACVITQVKTNDTDGCEAIQIAYGDQSERT